MRESRPLQRYGPRIGALAKIAYCMLTKRKLNARTMQMLGHQPSLAPRLGVQEKDPRGHGLPKLIIEVAIQARPRIIFVQVVPFEPSGTNE